MKTNQVLTRKLSDFNVNQRTSDGMFNATELLKQWNDKSGQQKQVVHFFENTNSEEFIQALIIEENFKERNSVFIKSKGKYGGTWMHPILFVKFAMWLNPRFEVKVIKFVYDELIKTRHQAGDAYITLGTSVAKIVPKSFLPIAIQKISQGMNHVIFNKHKTGIRNEQATEQNLRELYELEKKISDLIQEGFITSYDQLMAYLRRQWKNKYEPKVLQLN
jgi:hypothetical protein